MMNRMISRRNFLKAAGAAAAMGALSACGAASSGSVAASTAASGAASAANTALPKVTVWTLAKDLEQFGEYYTQQTGNEVEVVVIDSADYSTKLTTALNGKSDEADVIVGEPQMLTDFFRAGYFADLTSYGAADTASDLLVDYIVKAGQDESGVQRALSYQVTAGSVIYRRDLAKEVFGNDDPDFIHEKFATWDAILETAKTLKEKGYCLFGDAGSLHWFASSKPWVTDGVLSVSEDADKYFDTAVQLYQNEEIAFCPEWSAAWYASMAGVLPVNAGWSKLEELPSDTPTTQVFSYIMPSWGAVIIRDNAKDNVGNFGVCKGVNSFFGGGTFMGISSYSKNADAAWKFIEFCTLNEDTSKWWLEKSNGDVVSMKSVLDANKDFENPAFGNQKTYAFYLQEAQSIDYSTVTEYDSTVNSAYGVAIESVEKGEADKPTALKTFYETVSATYPDLKMPE